MKVIVVTPIDTNLVISVDGVLLCANDAERYVSLQEVKHRTLDYFIKEYSLATEGIMVYN